jgi:hypothetical protein
MKELLRHLWEHTSKPAAGRFFISLIRSLKAMKLPPLNTLAGTLSDHRANILSAVTHTNPGSAEKHRGSGARGNEICDSPNRLPNGLWLTRIRILQGSTKISHNPR